MLREAGTSDSTTILSTSRGLKAVTQWVIRRGILGQFSLAKEQLFGVTEANREEDIAIGSVR